MSSVNKVILIGRLGDAPDYKPTQGGSRAKLDVATTEKWKDKQGQMQEKTDWHRVILWNKLADIANQYLSKGSQVYLEGKLQTRDFIDQQGQKKYITEVVISGFNGVMQMLDSKKNNPQQQQVENRPAVNPKPQPELVSVSQDEFDDDIPF